MRRSSVARLLGALMSFAKFGFKICLPWPSALFFWMFGGPRVSLTFQWTLSCFVVVSFPPMRFWPQEIAEVTEMDMLQSPMPTSSIPRPSLRPWFSLDFENAGITNKALPLALEFEKRCSVCMQFKRPAPCLPVPPSQHVDLIPVWPGW